MSWQVYIERRPWDMATRLRIVSKTHPGSFDVVQPFMFKSHEYGECVGDDEIAIENRGGQPDRVESFLQALVNAAWDHGIKPVQMQDHSNELKAVRDHLSDMRSMAMKGRT